MLKISSVMLALCSILPYTWPIMLKINYAGIIGWSLNQTLIKLMMKMKVAYIDSQELIIFAY